MVDGRGTRWPVIAWALLYAVVAVLSGVGPLPMFDLVPPALVATAFAAWGFVRQGGPVINASALYCYATAVFVSFPAAYAGLVNDRHSEVVTSGLLLITLSIGVLALAVVLLICPTRRDAGHRGSAPSAGWSPGWIVTGFGAFGVALFSTTVKPLAAITIPQALGTLSILLLTLAWCDSRSGRARVISGAGVLVCSILYYGVIFEGFGRLVLGAIVCGALAIDSMRRRRYLAKVLLLAGTAPAIALLAIQRLDYLAQVRTSSASAQEGIASVTGPFVSFARIVQASAAGDIAPSWGSTVGAATVAWVPREWWPTKPVGFGAEMVHITQPSLVDAVATAGFSDAATIAGEVVWNLGLVLLPLGVLLLAVWLRWIDRLVADLDRFDARRVTVSPYRIVLVAVLVASTITLSWAGTFMLVARTLGMVLLIGAAWLLTRVFVRPRGGPQAVGDPSCPPADQLPTPDGSPACGESKASTNKERSWT